MSERGAGEAERCSQISGGCIRLQCDRKGCCGGREVRAVETKMMCGCMLRIRDIVRLQGGRKGCWVEAELRAL